MPYRTRQPTARAVKALLAIALAATAAATAPATASAQDQSQAPTQTGGIPPIPQPTPIQPIPAPQGTAFDGNGMWIWELPHSSGGNLDAIAARARTAGVTTVFVKSSDGSSPWRQFNSGLIQNAHARGLRVCGWGYVYGNRPTAEARAARTAIRSGADCFVIDAEAEYEGKYVSAQTYMHKLRAYAGPDYPIGLAGFPYVDYHPAFPYSVFMGDGGAQFNLPQMYWRAIGTTVDNVYAHAYTFNTPYARPIYPLGQTYGAAPKSQIIRFREFAQSFGARGVSWWSWQATLSSGWRGLASTLSALPAAKAVLPAAATLTRGARGDLVVWAQQHLIAAGQPVKPTGVLDSKTKLALKSFQGLSGLPVTGAIDPATWNALLTRPPAKIRYRSTAGPNATAAGSRTTAPPPLSATAPAVRNEIRSAPK
ncbi:MAG: hypothetical protein QOF37_496 [Thermoleophilaceae bacterium]|nr:hypothetical protein [Thermoleophilaceae bacterium]